MCNQTPGEYSAHVPTSQKWLKIPCWINLSWKTNPFKTQVKQGTWGCAMTHFHSFWNWPETTGIQNHKLSDPWFGWLVNLVIWSRNVLLKLFRLFVGVSALPATHIYLIPILRNAVIYRVMCFKCRGSWGCPEDYYSSIYYPWSFENNNRLFSFSCPVNFCFNTLNIVLKMGQNVTHTIWIISLWPYKNTLWAPWFNTQVLFNPGQISDTPSVNTTELLIMQLHPSFIYY